MQAIILLGTLGFILDTSTADLNRIVGGIDADIEKYPYLTSLQFDWYESAWRVACGGSIITTKTILSAAHCFEQRISPSNWRARVGSSYPTSGGQIHTIEKFILHENYNNLNNDVAIVKLNVAVTLSASVGTVRIAGHSYNLPDGTQFGGPNPEQLQEVNNYIINQELCWERYEVLRTMPEYAAYPEVTSSMICAGVLGDGGRDSCTGDSGGPMVVDGDVLIGITSWAYGCADPWYPGVKARVSTFVNWIVANGSCGTPDLQPHHGGVDADIEKYPFMANLQFDWYTSTWQITCGGTIITTRTILSAAHCFVDLNDPPHWRVRVGSSYPFIGGQVQTIQRFILHEDYDNLNNDIAIAVLNVPVTLSASVGTARIAGHRYHLAHDTQVTALGWGRIIWGGAFPDQLQEVDIYIIDQQLCWERYEALRNIPVYSHYPEVTAGMICAGILNHWGADSCSGDSGGPVIHDNDVVIGITSWAYGCGDPWYPGVNVRMTAFVNWVVANGSW